MRETTDTNSNFDSQEIPDGSHTFEIVQVRKNKGFYIWMFEYEDGASGEQVLFPNNMGALLRVLGCTEVKKGVYDWDTSLVEGQKFIAIVSHVPDKKDPNKIRQQMTEFKKAVEEDASPF
jgi:hypothetical protein